MIDDDRPMRIRQRRWRRERVATFILLILVHPTIAPITAVSAGGDTGNAFLDAVQAALQGSLSDLTHLLEADASLAQATVSSTGATALHYAAARGQTEMVRLLLSNGAPISPKTTSGATPLKMACASAMLEAACLLIEHDAEHEPSCGAQALHAAVASSQRDSVASLLQAGALTSIADGDDGRTVLHQAAINGDVEITSLLLQHGASHAVRYKDSGEHPLHVAAIKSHASVARVLLAAGADIEATSASGQTALHAAAIHGDGDGVIELLVERGAQLDLPWRLGATALHELAARGRTEAVALLMDGGATADLADAYGDTALTWAAARGHVATLQALLRAAGSAAAATRANRFGDTPLHAAAFNLHSAAIDAICEHPSVACDDALASMDSFGANASALYDATSAFTDGFADARSHEGRALDELSPRLDAHWLGAARRLVSSERSLLVHATRPEALDADALIRELALAKQSLTFDRRVREMLHNAEGGAMLRAPAVLSAEACVALRQAVDAGASMRHGGTDGMPEHTLHLERAGLEALIGHAATATLWALPTRYRQQAAAAQAAAGGDAVAAHHGEPRVMEIFIRRFSAATRPWIKMHADVAAVTVNVALSDEDDSSRGRLLTVYDGAVRAIDRRAGDATVHPSSLLHGVSRMVEGQRHTLIMFFA